MSISNPSNFEKNAKNHNKKKNQSKKYDEKHGKNILKKTKIKKIQKISKSENVENISICWGGKEEILVSIIGILYGLQGSLVIMIEKTHTKKEKYLVSNFI